MKNEESFCCSAPKLCDRLLTRNHPIVGQSSVFFIRDHLRGGGGSPLPMVKRSQYIRIKNSLHKHYPEMLMVGGQGSKIMKICRRLKWMVPKPKYDNRFSSFHVENVECQSLFWVRSSNPCQGRSTFWSFSFHLISSLYVTYFHCINW